MAMLTKIIARLNVRARDVVNEAPINNVVACFQLQVHTQINDVLSNLRNAAEENTLLGNNYFIDVNSMTLTDRKSR